MSLFGQPGCYFVNDVLRPLSDRALTGLRAFLPCVLLILVSPAGLAATSSPMDLLATYRQARLADAEFQAAGAKRDAVVEARRQSLGRLLPDVVLTGQASRTRGELLSTGNVFTRSFRNINPAYYNNSGFTLTLRQPLYRRDYWLQLQQADLRIAEAEAEYEAAAEALITRVAERYLDVLAGRDGLRFAEAEQAAIGRQLEQVKQRFEVGLVAITDVNEAQAAFDLARARTIVARNQLISAREGLREVTGQPAEGIAGLSEAMKLQSPEPVDVEAWGARALDQNLQVKAADLRLQIAEEEVRVRRSGHLPTLELDATHRYQNTGDPNFGSETQDTTLSLQLSLPIYQGGRTAAAVREAVKLGEQARHDLEGQRRKVLRQARDAFLTVLATIEQVEALRQARVSAQSALDATKAGFEVGTRTTVDVLSARQDLFRAERDYARARYDYLLNSLRLKEAVGALDTADLESVNGWFTLTEPVR